MALEIRELLTEVIKRRGTDLHIKAGSPVLIRESGRLTPLNGHLVTGDETRHLGDAILTPPQKDRLYRDLELDFAHAYDSVCRFRVNAHWNLGTVAFSFRLNRTDILSFDGLRLPPVLKRLAAKERGLILVTGITGSGKSTTLATMLHHINETRPVHIVTIEDPIEFIHHEKKALITQREVGNDTKSFVEALKHALRQDPDVILVGEMRDVETIRTGISAAETGHLVFSTLHTVQAAPTIDRIISFFPGIEQTQVRQQLAQNMIAVISQRLLPHKSGKGLVPALEIMVGTSTVRKLILEGKIRELNQAIQNREDDMQTFNQHLYELYKDDLITLEDALRCTDNVQVFKRMLSGSFSGGDKASILA